MAPKKREELEAEAKTQSDFMADASEVDQELDFDTLEATEQTDSNYDSGGESNTNLPDSEVDQLETKDAQEPSDSEKKEAVAETPPVPTEPVATEPVKPSSPEATVVADATLTTAEAQPASPSQTPPASSPEASEVPAFVTPEEIQQVYKDWRGQTEQLLGEHHYALTQEDLEEFEVEPQKTIPRLMAKVYLDAVTAAMSQITSNMPTLVRLTLDQFEKDNSSENAFFDRWPDLKDNKDIVQRVGFNYRKNNPSANSQQFIDEVGAMVMIALRKDPSLGRANGNGQAQPSPVPFTPAINSPAAAPPRQQSTNVFSELNAEFEEDANDFS